MSQCPQCGAQTTVDQPFCGTCGAPQAPAPQQPAPPGEAPTQMHGTPPPGGPQHYPAPQQPPQHGYGAPQGPAAYGSHPGQSAYGAPQQPYGHQQPGQYGVPPQQQYAPNQPGYGAPQQGRGPGVNFDVSRLLSGNWAGMAMVAGAAFGIALVLGAVFAFTTADDLDVSSAIAATLLIAGATFGPDVIAEHQSTGDITQTLTLGQFPLLITVLSLGAAIWLFRRSTSGVREVKVGLLDAARAALILMLGLVVLAVVMRIWSPEVTGYGSPDNGDPKLAPSGLGISTGDKVWLSVPGAIFLGFLLLFVVLALTCLLRADWLRGPWSRLHAWLSAPLHGIAALVALSLVAGVVYLLAIIIGSEEARGFDSIMRLVAVLPALGVRMFGLGVFANVGGSFTFEGDAEDDFQHLPDFADDNGMLFWIAPVLALGAMAGAVYTVIVKSLDRTSVARNVLVFLGLLFVAMPFLVRFSTAHASVATDMDGEEQKVSFWLGVEGVQTTFFFVLFALVVAVALLLLTGNLDVNGIVNKVKGAAAQARQQGQGGHGGHGGHAGQGGHQQWGQQAPAQGPPQGWGQQPPPQQGWGQQPPPQGPPQQGWGQQPPPQGPPQQGWGQQPPPQGPPQQGWGQQPPPQGPPQQGWGQQPPPQQQQQQGPPSQP